ncbi:E3 ubiquitin-protein ligase RNF169 [Corythoichthys intestinalis]|uniref:E3 ubiquitin-protein ligase RNF169 n=1 Tax=Corythoichthys intestinalis TaxID=161448 RepID=UPI0025A528C2|nr:E3 ubiquitin-protein ligase RNF169 [Corythoichthys intestinalis]
MGQRLKRAGLKRRSLLPPSKRKARCEMLLTLNSFNSKKHLVFRFPVLGGVCFQDCQQKSLGKMAAAAGTGRLSGKAAATAAAAGSRSAPGLGRAAAVLDARESARSPAAASSSPSSRRREAERGSGDGPPAAAASDAAAVAAEPGSGRSDVFVCPSLFPKSGEVPSAGPNVKHKVSPCEEREDAKRRGPCKEESREESGVPSDSENEEPSWTRVGRFSAFVRRSRTSAGVGSAARRSRSCTEACDNRGRKSKTGSAAPDAAVSGSAAGILLSSENSRSASAPGGAPERRPARLGGGGAPPERSVSPESNDSISEELNHFKPIVCSPRTPPKRLADGRLLEPALVKSTPRNLTWRLHKPTSYEASPAVLRRWRQIQLDRQSLEVDSKGTLTSPVKEVQEVWGEGAALPSNKRKLLFELPDAPCPKIRVPAVRYAGDLTFAGASQLEPGAGLGALLGRARSFSPYARQSGFRSTPSRQTGKSRGGPVVAARRERRDPAPAPRKQLESAPRPAGPVKYFLRSWTTDCGRPGLRRSHRINRRR